MMFSRGSYGQANVYSRRMTLVYSAANMHIRRMILAYPAAQLPTGRLTQACPAANLFCLLQQLSLPVLDSRSPVASASLSGELPPRVNFATVYQWTLSLSDSGELT